MSTFSPLDCFNTFQSLVSDFLSIRNSYSTLRFVLQLNTAFSALVGCLHCKGNFSAGFSLSGLSVIRPVCCWHGCAASYPVLSVTTVVSPWDAYVLFQVYSWSLESAFLGISLFLVKEYSMSLVLDIFDLFTLFRIICLLFLHWKS